MTAARSRRVAEEQPAGEGVATTAKSLRAGVANGVSRATGGGGPVVVAPTTAAVTATAAAATTVETPVRVVVDESALGCLDWLARGRLHAETAGVRTGDDLGEATVVVGEETVTVITSHVDGRVTEVVVSGDTAVADGVVSAFGAVWRSSTPADTPEISLGAVRETLADLGGSEAVADLASVDDPNDARVAVVWAAAGGAPLRREFVVGVADAVDITERSAERWLTRATDAGAVECRSDPDAKEGRGPTPKRIVRADGVEW